MKNNITYYSASEALDSAFETFAKNEKPLRKRNMEEVTISKGASMGFYWGETFFGKTKFVDLADRRILLWFGKTSERAGDGSFRSLWYQSVQKSEFSRVDNYSAVRLMRYGIDNKTQQGFAVVHEDELLESFRGYRSINNVEVSYCLVELNKYPDNWIKDYRQNSQIPIRKIPDEFEFGRIHPSQSSINEKLVGELVLYKPSVVDFICSKIMEVK
jgi:hypothetical protein